MIYTKCPHCGAMLSVPEEYKNDKRLHCSRCEQNFDNQIKAEKGKNSPVPDTPKRQTAQVQNQGISWTPQQKRGLWVLAIIICVCLYHCGAFGSSDIPQIGDRVIIVSNTWGTIDKDASDELGSSIIAGDAFGTYELVHDGKAKFIWEGSRGKVVHGSWTKVQVRFNDGSLYWVPTDAVRKE